MLKLDLLCLFLECLLLKISRNIFSPDSAVINILCDKNPSSIPARREKIVVFRRFKDVFGAFWYFHLSVPPYAAFWYHDKHLHNWLTFNIQHILMQLYG